MAKRSAQDIIDQAIDENRPSAQLLYVLATVIASVGVLTLIWAMWKGQPIIALAGSIPTALLWPAMNFAKQVRKENIAIRLLEAPLSRADTAAAASAMLKQLFSEVFGEKDKPGSALLPPTETTQGVGGAENA